jgi:hypothetical protein
VTTPTDQRTPLGQRVDTPPDAHATLAADVIGRVPRGQLNQAQQRGLELRIATAHRDMVTEAPSNRAMLFIVGIPFLGILANLIAPPIVAWMDSGGGPTGARWGAAALALVLVIPVGLLALLVSLGWSGKWWNVALRILGLGTFVSLAFVPDGLGIGPHYLRAGWLHAMFVALLPVPIVVFVTVFLAWAISRPSQLRDRRKRMADPESALIARLADAVMDANPKPKDPPVEKPRETLSTGEVRQWIERLDSIARDFETDLLGELTTGKAETDLVIGGHARRVGAQIRRIQWTLLSGRLTHGVSGARRDALSWDLAGTLARVVLTPEALPAPDGDDVVKVGSRAGRFLMNATTVLGAVVVAALVYAAIQPAPVDDFLARLSPTLASIFSSFDALGLLALAGPVTAAVSSIRWRQSILDAVSSTSSLWKVKRHKSK